MASQVIQLFAPTGLSTPTLRVFADGSDTQVSGSPFTLVEATNRKGYYTASFTGTLSGLHSVVLYDGSTVRGSGWVKMENADGTYYVRDDRVDVESAIDDLAGTGARTVTVTVNDGTSPLEGARVRMTKGAESYVQSTNASGAATFALDDGTWSVAVTLAGYQFTPTTLVVDGAESPTYSMTALNLTPSEPGLTTGYLTCYSELGVAESGVVVSLIASGVGSTTGAAHDETPRTATSDGDGVAEFTNLHKGVTYTYWRGSSTRRYSKLIPTGAGATYALPSIIG